MFVLNKEDRIEYVTCKPERVEVETNKLCTAISALKSAKLSLAETYYFAAQIHLYFVKIHPFQDGNGPTGRLLEKWFLFEKLGRKALAVDLEKNYFKKKDECYHNLRVLGLEYPEPDYSNP